MQLSKIFDRHAIDPVIQNNILTDGTYSVTYAALNPLLDKIGIVFTEQGLDASVPVAFACPHGLPGALVVMYLLRENYRFMLFAAPDGKHPDVPTPVFIRFRATLIEDRLKKGAVTLDAVSHWLNLVENPHFQPENNEAGETSKLYVRTSGSLGAAKIVKHGHASVMRNSLNCVNRWHLDARDRLLIPVPIYHMYGLGAAMIPGLIAGASMNLLRGANLLTYLERERGFHPTISFLTPALLEMVGRRKPPKSPYRMAVVAGDVVKRDTFVATEARFGCLVNNYGSTEMGVIAAWEPGKGGELRACSGLPMQGAQVRLGELRKAARDQAEVHVGELQCRHEFGFEGYLNGAGETVYRASRSDWYTTGDLARIHDNGYVELFARTGHSVNRDGRLVAFADVERIVDSLEGVDKSVVVSRGETRRGPGLVAYCLPRSGVQLDARKLRETCFDKFPAYAVPDEIHLIEAIPTLPNGKVNRLALT